MTLRRYAGLLWVQVRTSLLNAMQYRADFLLEGLIAIMWLGVALVPMSVTCMPASSRPPSSSRCSRGELRRQS